MTSLLRAYALKYYERMPAGGAYILERNPRSGKSSDGPRGGEVLGLYSELGQYL